MTTDNTILITGAGRGLGLATAERLLDTHPGVHLVLAVRDPDGSALRGLLERRGGDRTTVVRCNLAAMGSVRVAARAVSALLDDGRLPPLRGFVGNAGVQAGTATQTTPEGFEVTFATNVLGHYLLIRSLLDRFEPPARIVLVGSATHRGDFAHSGGMVPPPRWESVDALARPGSGPDAARNKAGKRAYTTSKLGVIYLVHELARRVPAGVNVYTFDPLMMPGTGLAREGTTIERAMWHTVFHASRLLPFATSPAGAARPLVEAVTGPPPGPSGSYLELGKVVKSSPESYDRPRETELWATAERLVEFEPHPADRPN